MAEVTYEKLQNNIVEEKINGSRVTVTFKCPATDNTFTGTATMPRKDGVGARVKQRAKRNMVYAAKRGFRSLMHNVFGGGVAGTTAGDVASSAVGSGSSSVEYDQKAGVVEAFNIIRDNFAWDESKKAFVDATAMEGMVSDFDRQLRDHPLVSKWDKGVAARMMVEIMAADGNVDDDERDFFEGFITDDTGTVDEMLEKGKLANIELEETTPDSRATMFMLANAMALIDESLDEAEVVRLHEFAVALGIRPEREEEIKNWAAEKVVENTIAGCYEDGSLSDEDKERLNKLAANIGVNEAMVAKLDIRVRKRQGIV